MIVRAFCSGFRQTSAVCRSFVWSFAVSVNSDQSAFRCVRYARSAARLPRRNSIAIKAEYSQPHQHEEQSKNDYAYFKRLAAAVPKMEISGGIRTNLTDLSPHFSTEQAEIKFPDRSSELNCKIVPALPAKSYNLAAYVNESETLSNLIKLGVDLSVVEQDVDVANSILKMNFERDIKPVLLFLKSIGIEDDNIGKCLTKSPSILCEQVENMQVRVNYLQSKKFSKEAIAHIVTKQPSMLTKSSKQTDAQLGFLQKEFQLNGDEVRTVVTRFPKIAIWSHTSLNQMKITLKEFLGFSQLELKQLLLADPKLLVSGKHAVMKRFDYLHNVVGFTHQQLSAYPTAMRKRLKITRSRHQFLKLLKRDNFDPTNPNYVSPKALTNGRDREFCSNVAKVSVEQFNHFLKTL